MNKRIDTGGMESDCSEIEKQKRRTNAKKRISSDSEEEISHKPKKFKKKAGASLPKQKIGSYNYSSSENGKILPS